MQVTLDGARIEALARVLGDTGGGLVGHEIGTLLARSGITDPGEMTKWRRLAAAFTEQTARDGSSNKVLRFVQEALRPERFLQDRDKYEWLRGGVNDVLRFAGVEINAAGEFVAARPVRTLDEVEQRRKRLLDELHRRRAHAEVLRYCTVELLRDDCFHAVAEACKGLMERIRTMTGSGLDGAALVDEAFALGATGVPLFAFNGLRDESEKSEQKGLSNLIKGTLGTFRNPTAHAPRTRWHVSEDDALDLFATLSFLHRRLDTAVRTR